MQMIKNYTRQSVNFNGRDTDVNSERGVFQGKPYIVMATEPGKVILMTKRENGKDWIVKAAKANDPLYQHIIKKRLYSGFTREIS